MRTRISRLESSPCALAPENLTFAREAADHHGEPEPEQARADDRTRDLRSDDVRVAVDQNEDGKHELGDRAETDVEKAADRRPGLGRDVFGGGADPVGPARSLRSHCWRRPTKARHRLRSGGRQRRERRAAAGARPSGIRLRTARPQCVRVATVAPRDDQGRNAVSHTFPATRRSCTGIMLQRLGLVRFVPPADAAGGIVL